MKRYALIRGARDAQEVRAYMPSNYAVIGEAVEGALEFFSSANGIRFMNEHAVFVIAGTDDAGWTLHDYVSPRLGSGNIGCEEIDLSHPVMKVIPE